MITKSSGSALFKATVPSISPVKVEDTVRFSWNQEKLHGFDPQSGLNRAQ